MPQALWSRRGGGGGEAMEGALQVKVGGRVGGSSWLTLGTPSFTRMIQIGSLFLSAILTAQSRTISSKLLAWEVPHDGSGICSVHGSGKLLFATIREIEQYMTLK